MYSLHGFIAADRIPIPLVAIRLNVGLQSEF